MFLNILFKIVFTATRAPRGPKVRGVSDLKSSKNLPLKYENSLFIAFLYYNFKKSGGSADPSDPVLAGPLIKILLVCYKLHLQKLFHE